MEPILYSNFPYVKNKNPIRSAKIVALSLTHSVQALNSGGSQALKISPHLIFSAPPRDRIFGRCLFELTHRKFMGVCRVKIPENHCQIIPVYLNIRQKYRIKR